MFLNLILCTFSFKIKKVACLLQDVVSPHCVDKRMVLRCIRSPHCGDKRMVLRCIRFSVPNYFVMTSWLWIAGKNASM